MSQKHRTSRQAIFEKKYRQIQMEIIHMLYYTGDSDLWARLVYLDQDMRKDRQKLDDYFPHIK